MRAIEQVDPVLVWLADRCYVRYITLLIAYKSAIYGFEIAREPGFKNGWSLIGGYEFINYYNWQTCIKYS